MKQTPIFVVLLLLAGLLPACTRRVVVENRDGSTTTLQLDKLGRTSAWFEPLDLPGPSETRLASGAPGPAYWQNRADYVIDATLDAERSAIDAVSTVTYTNNSPHELAFLWIHLEQDMYRLDSSATALSRQSARFGNRFNFDGGKVIRSVVLHPGTHRETRVELQRAETLARLDLPEPLRPGDAVAVRIDYSFDIPKDGSSRMGMEEVDGGTIYQIAQWIPQIAKYDDVDGWNTLPYLGKGEFYTDLGTYDVSITVPGSYLVAATGELTNPEAVLTSGHRERLDEAMRSSETVVIHSGADRTAGDADGTVTWRFRADDVRTFTFAASDVFLWDAASLDVEGERVLCQSFYPPSAKDVWEQSTPMVLDSVRIYSAWFPYPYPVCSNVNGPVYGMEYPMVSFVAEREDDRTLWHITTHEVAHNWFPMMVNTNERRHAWMDEGLVSLMNHYASLERYPDELPWSHPRVFVRREWAKCVQPTMTEPDKLIWETLGATQYRKPAAGLITLREGVLGEARFDAAMREYIRRWSWRSPTPADFFRTMEDVSGEDLTWLWRGWFAGTGHLDQAVTGVMQAPGTTDAGAGSTCRVTFKNLGGIAMPLVYEVAYDDGTSERRRVPVQAWHTDDTFIAAWDAQGRRIESVTVDPDQTFPDTNIRNNVWD